jgi:hypothetical protein
MSLIHDVLKANGYTDEQITSVAAALGTNPDAVKVFEDGLVAADEKLRQATIKLEEADRKNDQIKQWWEGDATRQINDAYSKVAQAEARAAYYKQQTDSARESGFLPAEAPVPAPEQAGQARSPDGRFVPNAGAVPGSPVYMTQADGWKALSSATWAITRYAQLFDGKPLPDDVATLVQEAVNARMEFQPYVSQKYDFPKREKEITSTRQKEHDDKIAKDALEAYKKEQAERNGSNPDLRPGQTSNFSKFQQPQPGQTGRDRLSWARPDAKEKMREYAHQRVAQELERNQAH